MALGKIIREFGVKLSLIYDSKGVKHAQKELEELGHSLKHIGLHVAEASAALLEIANLSGEHSRALEENSQQLGINTDRLQELSYAAKIAANVGREELVGSLQGLSTELDNARRGTGDAGKALIALGVPMSVITDRTIRADQVMLMLADRFKDIKDPIAKTALAQQVFGSSGAKLLPLLNKGAQGMAAMGKEARALGLIMDEGMIEKGAEFDRTLSRIWMVLKNITFTIGAEMIKYLEPLVHQFQNFIVLNKKFIVMSVASVFKAMGKYLEIVFKFLNFVVARMKGLVSILGGTDKIVMALAIGFGILTSAKILNGIGILMKSWRAVALVMTGLNITTMALAAALLAVILVVQDLFSDDSMIKEWFKSIEEQFPMLKSMVELFSKFSGMMGSMAPKSESKGFFSGIKEGLAGLSNMKLTGVNLFGEATPSGGAAAGGSTKTDNSNTNMTANITVQVPPGTGAKAATEMVSEGAQDGFKTMLRQSRNQAVGGAAY